MQKNPILPKFFPRLISKICTFAQYNTKKRACDKLNHKTPYTAMTRNLLPILALALCGTANVAAQTEIIGEQADIVAETVATATPSAASAAYEYARFGYLSYNDVLHSMPAYAEAQQTLAEMRTSCEAELRRSEENFSKIFAEFIEGQRSFPENILLKRQKELHQLMEQTLKFKEEARALLQKSEQEVIEPLRRQIDNAIRRIGLERGYAYVLNTDNNTYPFVNGDIGTDITADVLELLQQ